MRYTYCDPTVGTGPIIPTYERLYLLRSESANLILSSSHPCITPHPAGIASGDVEIFAFERGSGGPAVHLFLPEHGRACTVTEAKAGADGESYQGV
jgi:hypothetical protein